MRDSPAIDAGTIMPYFMTFAAQRDENDVI